MKMEMKASGFIHIKGIEYFKFEEDFMEENVRCIPLIVRFKMDLVGIKLKLGEWGRFYYNERVELALLPVNTAFEKEQYSMYLTALVTKHTGNIAARMAIDHYPEWKNLNQVPGMLTEKSSELQMTISIPQWKSLTKLQRFALLKLCRPGHENKNFPKAVIEFGLMTI